MSHRPTQVIPGVFILTRYTVSWEPHPGVSTTKYTSVFFLLQRSALSFSVNEGMWDLGFSTIGSAFVHTFKLMCMAQPTFPATLVIIILLTPTRIFVQPIP